MIAVLHEEVLKHLLPNDADDRAVVEDVVVRQALPSKAEWAGEGVDTKRA